MARKYDHEYKVQAVKLAKEIGGAKAAKELGIPEGTIHTWLKAVRAGKLERFILLLYGLGFNDGEIADLLKIVRRTVNYKRQRGFEKVRKRMEEKQHEE